MFATVYFGCNPVNSPGGNSSEVYLWIGSDKDSYVSCGMPSGNCPEQNFNFGLNSFLVVANSSVALKKTYIHFTLPGLPSGSQIEEAYLELFHPGKNEDGKSDNILIPVGLASSDWKPLELNYATEPDHDNPLEEFNINLRSQGWSGSINISNLMQRFFFTSEEFHGFHLFWPYQSQGIEKGFYSNNYKDRKVNDMGLAPRLLLKVHLTEGKSVADITFPARLPNDTDLYFPGQQVKILQSVSGGDTWPAEWDVASIK